MKQAPLSEYQEYLHTPHWIKLRRKIVLLVGQCWICRSKKHLELHHERYDHLGHEKLTLDVFVVCQHCHQMIHFDKFLFFTRKIPLDPESLKQRRIGLKIWWCFWHARVLSFAWYSICYLVLV